MIFRRALSAAWLHGQTATPSGSALAVIADAESQLCMAVCGVAPAGHRESITLLSRIAAEVCIAADSDPLTRLSAVLTATQSQVELARKDFISDVWTHVVQTANPAASNWSPLAGNSALLANASSYLKSEQARLAVAHALWIKAHLLSGVPIPNPVVLNDLRDLAAKFEVAIDLYLDLARRLWGRAGPDLTKRKHSNTIWDLNIAFVLSDGRMGGLQTCLVTDDGGVRAAASRMGYSDRVLKLGEYLALLGVP